MENYAQSNNFIDVLYNLRNTQENPFNKSNSSQLKNKATINPINYLGTFEDIFVVVRCPICLSRVISAKRSNDCRHIFCSLCLKKWIKQSPFCPVCRKPIKKLVNVNLSEEWVTFQGNLFIKYF